MARRGENVRKRKDGRWEARYPKGKDEYGRTVYGSVYAGTYKEVKEKRRRLLEADRQVQKSTSKVIFRDLLTLWISDNEIRLKPSTIYKYQYLIDTHIGPELGDAPVGNLSGPVINAFLARKSQSGRLDGSGGLSAAYVRSIAQIIGAAMRFGAEQGLCKPEILRINKPAVLHTELTVLSATQQGILEDSLKKEMDATKLGIYISLYTGLRIGEICALTWDDIDLKNQLIYVRNTVARVKTDAGNGSKTHLIIDTPKTSSSRRCIPICSNLLSVLNAHSQRDTSSYVVTSAQRFMSPRTFDYRFKRTLAECKLPSVNYHILRHTFATRCIEAGVDVKSLSEILGHSNVSITLNTYVHSSMALKRTQLEKLSCLSN